MNLRTVLPELLPPAAADCAWGVRWHSQIKIRVINPPGRSTYPKQKSVSTSGATPTKGTAPQFGIDMEPNAPEDVLDDILLLRVRTRANVGGGIVVSLRKLDMTSEPVRVSIVEHRSSVEARPLRTNMPADFKDITIRYSRAK